MVAWVVRFVPAKTSLSVMAQGSMPVKDDQNSRVEDWEWISLRFPAQVSTPERLPQRALYRGLAGFVGAKRVLAFLKPTQLKGLSTSPP